MLIICTFIVNVCCFCRSLFLPNVLRTFPSTFFFDCVKRGQFGHNLYALLRRGGGGGGGMKRRGDRPQHAHTLIRQINSRKRAQQHHCPHPNANTNQSSANNFIYRRHHRRHHHDDKHSSSSHRCAIWPTTLTPPPQSHIIGHHSITPISQIPLF